MMQRMLSGLTKLIAFAMSGFLLLWQVYAIAGTDREKRFFEAEKALIAYQKNKNSRESLPVDYQAIQQSFINIYREKSTDDLAFRSIMYIFFSTFDPGVKSQQFDILTGNHRANPEVANLLTGPITAAILTPDYVNFLEAFISGDAPAVSRASAMVALAQSYDAVLNQQSALKAYSEPGGNFEGDAQELDEYASNEIYKTNYRNWMAADPEMLKNQIAALASEVVEKYSDVDLQYYSPKEGVKPIAKAGQIARGLLNGLILKPGEKAPATRLTALDGSEVKLSDYLGKVVVMDFWATWCVPCIEAMPKNREMVAEFSKYPFEFITVSVDADIEDVRDFLAENSMPFVNTHIGPESPVLSDWNVSSYPTVYVVDAQGKIDMRHAGDPQSLKKHIKSMLNSMLQ